MTVYFTNTFSNWNFAAILCFSLFAASCSPEAKRTLTEDFLQQAETEVHSDKVAELDTVNVQYRIDKQVPNTKSVRISTNNTFAGRWNSNTATPYGENPGEMTFNISNLKSEIQPLRDACGW